MRVYVSFENLSIPDALVELVVHLLDLGLVLGRLGHGLVLLRRRGGVVAAG